MSEYQSPAGIVSPGIVPESRPGVPYSPSNPLPVSVSNAGSTGLDFSTNAPALPLIGNGFGTSGPYANYLLIRTVPANPGRNNLDIENNSGAQIAILRDDGSAATGSAPNAATIFALAGGAGIGSQGGSWSTASFKGRIQVFAPSATAQVAVFQD